MPASIRRCWAALARVVRRHDATACLLGFLFAGLLLRLYRIDYPALHHDEAYSINGILTPTWEALKFHIQYTDIFPPLIYLIQKSVYRFFPTVAAMRVISALAGVAAVGLAYWAVRPLVLRRRALLLAGFCALSYFMIWYSREVRSYVFHFASVILTLGFLIRVALATRPRPPVRLLAGFLVGNVLGIQFHYNMMLAWPLMGLVFVLWELLRLREDPGNRFRWSYVIALAAAGAAAVLSMLPILPLFMKAISMAGGEKVFPPLALLYRKICSTGWGTGWYGAVWCGLLALGLVRSFRTSKRAFLMIATFLGGTVAVYLYGIRFPLNFTNNLQKYVFLFSFAALLAAVFGVEQITSSLSAVARRRLGRRINPWLADLLILVALFGLALPVFSRFYQLKGASFTFKEIPRVLTALGQGNLLIDNYYDLQFIRHYIPRGTRVAFPPVYGTPDEFSRYGDAAFIRELAASDPLLVFWDSLAAREYGASAQADWSWLSTNYVHCVTLYNTNGVYLSRRALNFHPFHADKTGDLPAPHLYYNTPADLPQWFARRNMRCGTAFGANWYHLTYLGGDGAWRHTCLTTGRATFYVCNATANPLGPVRLDIVLAGCSPQQNVSLFQGDRCLGQTALSAAPTAGFDMQSRKSFQQYISLGRMFSASEGTLSVPAAFQFNFSRVTVDQLTLPPGCTLFSIETSSPDGLLVPGISVSCSP